MRGIKNMKLGTNIYSQREKRPAMNDEPEAQTALLPGVKNPMRQEFGAARRRHIQVRRLALGLFAVYVLLVIGWLAYAVGKFSPAAGPPAPKKIAPAPAASIPLSVAEAEQRDFDQLSAAIGVWRMAPDKLKQARDLRQRGHQDNAQRALEQLRKDNPHNLELQLELAQIYLNKKQFRRAADLLQSVLDMDPACEPARIALASAYSQLARHDLALALAQWILESSPDSIPAHRVAAAAYQRKGRAEQELIHLRKWAMLDPTSLGAEYQVAEALIRGRDYDKAQPLLEEIVKKDPSYAEAFRLLAVCYAQQTQVEKSVDILVRALSLFGAPRIAGWFGDKGFDAVRDHKLFIILQQQLNSPALAVRSIRGAEERIDLNAIIDTKKSEQLEDQKQKKDNK